LEHNHQAFKGAVLMVSHNGSFMGECCNEMWAVEKGKVAVHHISLSPLLFPSSPSFSP
jgi:ATPase subunit of ABC transporter with duplicated ATPase domains